MADLVEVADLADPRLADFRDLRDVDLRVAVEAEHGLFLAEGAKVVRRAAEAGFVPRSFLLQPKWVDGLRDVLDASEAPAYVLPEREIAQVTGFHLHRGALASFERKPLPELADLLARPGRLRVAVLEDLVDHGNVGLIFRNAAALGIDAVVLTERTADPLYRRASKTSMGNVYTVPWTRGRGMEDILAALRAADVVPVALTLADDAITLDDLVALGHERLAFVFGTEGAGVHPKTEQQVAHRVLIPMEPGVDSLNVAAATAVTFYATR
jgi:tRNA G18 (ribose-2'-O)-methylase SpoU